MSQPCEHDPRRADCAGCLRLTVGELFLDVEDRDRRIAELEAALLISERDGGTDYIAGWNDCCRMQRQELAALSGRG